MKYLGDAQQWQAPLWQALVSYTAEGQQPVAPRQSLPALYQYPEKADEPPAGLPSRVFIWWDFCAAASSSVYLSESCRR
ncbi:exodeoxyribonuclease V subunit gamma [Klebsiella pneumoniae]|nr:exodeoxyribonuclease V subunit gamma [Klebsiella pneumoniae]